MAPAPDLLTPSRRRRWPTIVLAVAGVGCTVAGALVLAAGPGPADVGDLPTAPSATAGASPPAAASGPGPVGDVPPAGEGRATGTAPVAPIPGADGHAATGVPFTAGTVPVELSLPDRRVTAPVVPVGTGPTGAMVIPEPPSTVGWWSPGPLAGSATGRAVLAGHVDSRTGGLGAFAGLREAEIGEAVVVRGSDGRELRYAVAARREYGKADLPTDLFTPGGPPGLVLITCGGRFDPVTGHYEDNVVVHAVPAG